MIKIFIVLALFLVSNLCTAKRISSADINHEPPKESIWIEEFTEEEFKKELKHISEEHKLALKENPFLISEYPTITEWEKIISNYSHIQRVLIFREDGKDPNNYLFGIAIEIDDGFIKIVREERGYKASNKSLGDDRHS